MPLSIVFALEISGSTKNFILLVLVLFLICKITEIPESGYKKVPPFPDKCGTINKNFTGIVALKSSWWVLISVLFEELIFRGALLYIAIKLIGITKACILSAVCFGIYHWFSYGAFGNPVQMLFIFLMTGFWGYMFAMAFARTRSLYLPIGLHFGWNLVSTVVFSNGPLGNQLILKYNGLFLTIIPSLIVFALQVFPLPVITFWYLRRYKNKVQH